MAEPGHHVGDEKGNVSPQDIKRVSLSLCLSFLWVLFISEKEKAFVEEKTKQNLTQSGREICLIQPWVCAVFNLLLRGKLVFVSMFAIDQQVNMSGCSTAIGSPSCYEAFSQAFSAYSLLQVYVLAAFSLLFFWSCDVLQCRSEAVLHNHFSFSTCIKSERVSFPLHPSHTACRSFTFLDDKGVAFTFSHCLPLHQISFPALCRRLPWWNWKSSDGNAMHSIGMWWSDTQRVMWEEEEEEEKTKKDWRCFPRRRKNSKKEKINDKREQQRHTTHDKHLLNYRWVEIN